MRSHISAVRATDRVLGIVLGLGLTVLTTAGFAQVVINEIDYDQPDTAEFIELRSHIKEVSTWPINADEPQALDYNDAIADPGESSGNTPLNLPTLYRPDPFRSSDHDPVIIGLEFDGTILSTHFESTRIDAL